MTVKYLQSEAQFCCSRSCRNSGEMWVRMSVSHSFRESQICVPNCSCWHEEWVSISCRGVGRFACPEEFRGS